METATAAKSDPHLKQEVDYKAWDREREEWEAERKEGEKFNRWVYFFAAWFFVLLIGNVIVINLSGPANPWAVGILFVLTGAAVWFENRSGGVFN